MLILKIQQYLFNAFQCGWPFDVCDPAQYSGKSDPRLYLKWHELHLQHGSKSPTLVPIPSILESSQTGPAVPENPILAIQTSSKPLPPASIANEAQIQPSKPANPRSKSPFTSEAASNLNGLAGPSQSRSIFDDLDLSDDDEGSNSDGNPPVAVASNHLPAPSPARSLLSEEDFGLMSPFSGQSSPWSPRLGGVPPSPRTSETDSEFRCPIPKYLRTVSQMHLPQMLSPLPLTPRRRDEAMSDSESDTAGLTPRVDRMNDFRLSPQRRASPTKSSIRSDEASSSGLIPSNMEIFKSPPAKVDSPMRTDEASISGLAPSGLEIFKSPPSKVDSPKRVPQTSPVGSPMKMVLKKDGANDSWQINSSETNGLDLKLPDLDQKSVTQEEVHEPTRDEVNEPDTPVPEKVPSPILERVSSPLPEKNPPPVTPIKSYSKRKDTKSSPQNQVLGSLSNRLSMNVGVPVSIVLPNSTHDLPTPPEKENQDSSANYIKNLSKRLNWTPDDLDHDFKSMVKGLGQDPVSLELVQKVQTSLKMHNGHASDRRDPKLVFHVGDGKAAIDLPQDTMDVSVNAQKDNVSMFLCSNSDGVEGQALKVAPSPGTLTTPEQYRPKRGRPRKVLPQMPGPTRFPSPDEILGQAEQNDDFPYYGPEFQAFLNDPQQVAQFKHHIQLLMQDFQLDQSWIQSGVDPVVAMLICRAYSNMGGPIDFFAVLNWYGKLINYENLMAQQPTASPPPLPNPVPPPKTTANTPTPSSTPVSTRPKIAHVSPMSSPSGTNSPQQTSSSPVIKTEILDLPSPMIGSNKSVIPTSVRPAPRSVTEVSGQAPATSSGLVGKGKYKMTCTFNNSLIGPVCVETEAEMKAVMAIIRDNSAKNAHRGRPLLNSPQYFSDAESARSLLSAEVLAYLDKAFTLKGLRENVIGKRKKNYPKRSQIIKIDPKTGEKIYPNSPNKSEILKIKQEFDEAQASKQIEAERLRKTNLRQQSELKAQRREPNLNNEGLQKAVTNILSVSGSTSTAPPPPPVASKTLNPQPSSIKHFAVKSVPPVTLNKAAESSTSAPLTTSNLHNLNPTLTKPTPQNPQFIIQPLEQLAQPETLLIPSNEPSSVPVSTNKVVTKSPPLPRMKAKGRRKYGGFKAKKPTSKTGESISPEKSQSIAAKILDLPLNRLIPEAKPANQNVSKPRISTRTTRSTSTPQNTNGATESDIVAKVPPPTSDMSKSQPRPSLKPLVPLEAPQVSSSTIFVRKGQETKVQRLLKKRKVYSGFATQKSKEKLPLMAGPKLAFSKADNIGGVKRLIKSNGEVVEIPVASQSQSMASSSSSSPSVGTTNTQRKIKKPAKTSQEEQDILADLFKVAETLDIPPVVPSPARNNDLFESNNVINDFNMAMGMGTPMGDDVSEVLSFEDMF